MGNLELISVNIPHIIITIINLLILFLLIKKFLFKPVQRILDARKAEVDKIYADAHETQEAADKDKQLYEEKLETAEAEADAILESEVEYTNCAYAPLLISGSSCSVSPAPSVTVSYGSLTHTGEGSTVTSQVSSQPLSVVALITVLPISPAVTSRSSPSTRRSWDR